MHGKTMRLLELYLIFVLYMLTLFCLWKRRENCYYRTRNNGLRYYRTSIVDFAKTTFETLALCFTRHLVLLITFLISNTCILPWDDRIALQSYSRKSGQPPPSVAAPSSTRCATWLVPGCHRRRVSPPLPLLPSPSSPPAGTLTWPLPLVIGILDGSSLWFAIGDLNVKKYFL